MTDGIPTKPEWWRKRYAQKNGYFWTPCPICTRMFGGHEWLPNPYKPTSIYSKNEPNRGTAICPWCVADGSGALYWATENGHAELKTLIELDPLYTYEVEMDDNSD